MQDDRLILVQFHNKYGKFDDLGTIMNCQCQVVCLLYTGFTACAFPLKLSLSLNINLFLSIQH